MLTTAALFEGGRERKKGLVLLLLLYPLRPPPRGLGLPRGAIVSYLSGIISRD